MNAVRSSSGPRLLPSMDPLAGVYGAVPRQVRDFYRLVPVNGVMSQNDQLCEGLVAKSIEYQRGALLQSTSTALSGYA